MRSCNLQRLRRLKWRYFYPPRQLRSSRVGTFKGCYQLPQHAALTATVGVQEDTAGQTNGSSPRIAVIPVPTCWQMRCHCPIIQDWIARRLHHFQFWDWSTVAQASPWQPHSVIHATWLRLPCAQPRQNSLLAIWILSEETWHSVALKVHALMASPLEIEAFLYGGLAGTNVYANLSQWLWPSGLLLNL